MKTITIICPVYNEEKLIKFFIKKIENLKKIKNLKKYKFNIFFSNNASNDKTLKVIQEISKGKNIYYQTLSKNFGYQNSINFALKNTIGDLYVIIDVDGEDPPELIEQFIKQYELGFDIVYGLRVNRDEFFLKKKLRWLFYRILKIVSDDDVFLDMAEFSLFTNEVKTALLEEKTTFPFVRTSLSRLGFNSKSVEYTRLKRKGGISNYNLFQNIKFAVAGILSSSTLPLRISLYSFPVLLFASLTMLIFDIYYELSFLWKINIYILIIHTIFINSFIAIYIARIYKNSLNRPNAHLIKRFTRLQIK